ncbi:MAG: hypothetical protein JNL58_23500 [Planctomyces sp.]|nr:hypothetical protein [Planctomyces sp.]
MRTQNTFGTQYWLAALILFSIAGFSRQNAVAGEKLESVESDYYEIIRYPIPEGIVLEAGAVEILPDQTVAIATRRGQIFIVHNFFGDDPQKVEYRLFADGLHEVLGLTWRDGSLYATQRCEVTRLRDSDQDGLADEIETFNDDWGINGDYHEYAFGSPFDKDGNMYVALCLTGSFGSDSKWRGWSLKIDRDGKMTPFASGLRSPGGIGFDLNGELFYTDNQGPWNGTCSLKWLKPGAFQGHPAGLKWYSLVSDGSLRLPEAAKSGTRMIEEADRNPDYEPPAILFPYQKMGQSASGFACDDSEGRFGPFHGQMFVGDVTHSTVMRCYLEKVGDHYQGACFPFREGLSSGSLALKMASDGSLIVGGTNRGWGSRGTEPFALERLRWKKVVPFEIQAMRAASDGFLLTLTEPVDVDSAKAIDSWSIQTYTYIFQESYGSPEVDHTTPKIREIHVSDDGLQVHLVIDGLKRGHVHELQASGVRSRGGNPLLHSLAYYTLNSIPKE